jgi:hypothetical protein
MKGANQAIPNTDGTLGTLGTFKSLLVLIAVRVLSCSDD